MVLGVCLHELFDHTIRQALSAPGQANAMTPFKKQIVANQRPQSFPKRGIELARGLLPAPPSIDSFHAAKLRPNRLEGPVPIVQLFALKDRRLSRQNLLDICLGISCIQLPDAPNISCCSNSKPIVSLVGPVALVVTATKPW